MTNLPPLPPSDHPALGGGHAGDGDSDPLIADIDNAAARLRKTIAPAQDDAVESEDPQTGTGGLLRRLFRGRR